MFTGQEKDEETGLYNYRARLYDPYLKRFLDTDSAGQGFTPYAYAGNNPVVFVDPDGEIFVPMLIGAGFGVLTNGMNNLMYGQPFFRGATGAAFLGGFQGAFSFGIGQVVTAISSPYLRVGFQTLAHGHLGGMMSGPGNYGTGFLAGSLGSLTATGMGALLKNQPPGLQFFGMTHISAIMGGLGSDWAGGSFADGFRTGMISGGLNHGAHLMKNIWDDGMGGAPIEQQASAELAYKIMYGVGAGNNAFGIASGIGELNFISDGMWNDQGHWTPLRRKEYWMSFLKGRSNAIKYGNLFRGIGYTSFGIGSTLSGGLAAYNLYNGNTMTGLKYGFDGIMGGVMVLGPGGLFIGSQYVFYDTFGWNNIGNHHVPRSVAMPIPPEAFFKAIKKIR